MIRDHNNGVPEVPNMFDNNVVVTIDNGINLNNENKIIIKAN